LRASVGYAGVVLNAFSRSFFPGGPSRCRAIRSCEVSIQRLGGGGGPIPFTGGGSDRAGRPPI
jgi:hypothetical protein